MSQHTKGPWKTRGSSAGSDYVHIESDTVERIAVTRTMQDAARIVACVNSCEGIPDDKLESWMNPPEGQLGAPHGTWAQQLAVAGRKQVELMTALKEASAADDYFYMREVIDAAIAKAESQS